MAWGSIQLTNSALAQATRIGASRVALDLDSDQAPVVTQYLEFLGLRYNWVNTDRMVVQLGPLKWELAKIEFFNLLRKLNPFTKD
jgi:hypothetical protein